MPAPDLRCATSPEQGQAERDVHAVLEQAVEGVAGRLVVGVEHHRRERVRGESVGEDAPHDDRRHDPAGRCDEGHVPEEVGAPAAKERMAGEQVDGIDLAKHQPGGFIEALAQVQRGRDHLALAAQREQATGVHRQQRAAARARQAAAAVRGMDVEAAALPEAELAGVGVDHQVDPAAEAPLVVALCAEQVLVEAGAPEVEAQALLVDGAAQAAPVAAELVPGQQRSGQRRIGRWLRACLPWRSGAQGQQQRSKRMTPVVRRSARASRGHPCRCGHAAGFPCTWSRRGRRVAGAHVCR